MALETEFLRREVPSISLASLSEGRYRLARLAARLGAFGYTRHSLILTFLVWPQGHAT
jgi:hypothetical protein